MATPQYTPTTGYGTVDKGYTFTKSGWTQNPVTAQPKIEATKIGTKPVIVPTQKQDTTQYNAITSGAMSSVPKTFTTPNGAEVDAATGAVITPAPQAPTAPTESKNLFQTIKDQISGGTFFGAEPTRPDIAGTEAQYGVDQKTKDVNDLTAQLNAINAEAKASQLSLEGQGRGQTTTFISGEQSRLERDRAIRALPIAAALDAAQGNLQSAQSKVDQAIQLESDYQDKLYKFNTDKRNAVWDIATAEEKQRLAEIQRREDLAQESNKNLYSLKTSLVGEAIKSGQQNLIPLIMGAKDQNGVTSVAAQLKTQVDPLKALQIREQQLQNQKLAKEVRPSVPTTTSSDPFINKLLATVGGKPLTDTSIQKLDKGLTVLSQLGTLEANIKDVKTGPIVGLFKGANPWDTNAQVIKAQLNAIVPNLARGVYGEVGVLTDNDIATYSKTLPNLKSTEDVRNAVLGITVDLIGKSIKKTLEVNAANQKDVSGFVDIYTEMENARNSIFQQIPGYGEKSQTTSSPLKTGYSGTLSSGLKFSIE